MLPSMLPELTPDQAAQSAAVMRALRAAIAAHSGWLAFDDYLRLVLYAPGLGYYSAGSAKLGAAGDFVTAPELSDLFARCLASQCAPLLRMGGGDVLELGAGTGRLALGLMRRLAELGDVPAHYYILEVSADLRQRQQALLQQLPRELRSRLEWLDAPPATPITGVILANEVADALPFRRFVIDSGRFYERGVGLSAAGALVDADCPAAPDLIAELTRIAPGAWPQHYLSELCPMLAPWVASMAAPLARGLLLLIDYGLPRPEYYHPQRDRGTLRCHFRHRAHDQPLLYPGVQDVTAWVDFTRVAEAAVDAGLTVGGYCTQAAFLLASGIEAEVAAAVDTIERARLASQARSLLLPGEMGENFKVMALTRGLDLPLRGFALQDLRRTL
ncbi:MAG TPA: SAM-dependent methyltransferase [Steroidobacteraceae bacterium]|jgi:SAM-dependent MidA family methyltransferase|nr:SAM-dependent methyltransferase [Steroidobacteraceae bacterium]